MVTARVDLNGLRQLGLTAQDIGRSAIIAATRTANDIRPIMRRRIANAIDRPTRFTLNAVTTIGAQLADPTPAAEVRFRDFRLDSRHYLTTLEDGGPRAQTGLEAALRRAGRLLPGEFLVPSDEGSGVTLDRFGNVPRRVYPIIMSDLRAQNDASANSTRDSRARRRRRRAPSSIRGTFFLVRPEREVRLPPGIYLKQPFGELDLWFHLVRGAPRYSDGLGLREIARQNVDDLFRRRFAEALGQGAARRVAQSRGLTTSRPRGL